MGCLKAIVLTPLALVAFVFVWLMCSAVWYWLAGLVGLPVNTDGVAIAGLVLGFFSALSVAGGAAGARAASKS
jgi:hypothetical protein